jgi:hypothetical protein
MDAVGAQTMCPANAGDKLIEMIGGDGGKKAGSPGRSRSSRSTIAQGVPIVRLYLW